MKSLIISGIILIFFLLPVVAAQEAPPHDAVGIHEHLIVMPLGRILLIKRGNFGGAIIFIENERRKDVLYSKYECFEYKEEKGSLIKIREGVISLREPSKGFFYKLRSILQIHDDPFRYADKLTFEGFELFAHPADEGHSTIYFWNRPNEVDPKVCLAPTPWKRVDEVNLSDARIKWFAHDEKRRWRVIPVDKLWE